MIPPALRNVLYVMAAFLLADFVTGVFHWWEDRYGNPAWPVIGKLVVEPNILHHARNEKFTDA